MASDGVPRPVVADAGGGGAENGSSSSSSNGSSCSRSAAAAAAVSSHYEEGYRECLREAMQWMVEHEGFIPGDPICARLMNHLHEHIELVLKGNTLSLPTALPTVTTASVRSLLPINKDQMCPMIAMIDNFYEADGSVKL